jgi:hypothetical protein
MEEDLIEMSSIRRFAGIYLMSDRIPDETTILTFRHLLVDHELGDQIYQTVKTCLKDRGMAAPIRKEVRSWCCSEHLSKHTPDGGLRTARSEMVSH